MPSTRNPWIKAAGPRGWGWPVPGALLLAVGACGFPRPPDLPGDASTQFAVAATEPAVHAASVDPRTLIRVTFSSNLGGSVPQLAVATADGAVAGNVSVDGAVVTFHPAAPLGNGTPVTVIVTSASDAAGNALAAPVQFDFTTKTTLCVKPGGGDGCYARPSEAVAAAASGDSIAVLEGDYADNVAVSKSITLLGGFAGAFTTRDPASHVSTIRPTSAGAMNVPIIGLASGSLVLDGLSLVDGKNTSHGGGIRVDGGTARIQDCVIARNSAFFTGGGVYINGGATRRAGRQPDRGQHGRRSGQLCGCGSHRRVVNGHLARQHDSAQSHPAEHG